MGTEALKEIREKLDMIYASALSQKPVLSIDELCSYASFKKSQVYKMTMSQEIPHYKPRGKEIYFNREEIDEWLLQNRISTKDEIDQRATTHITTKKM